MVSRVERLAIGCEGKLLHATYPSAYSFLSTLGTLKCHQRQSVASMAKMLPDDVSISVESCQIVAVSLT